MLVEGAMFVAVTAASATPAPDIRRPEQVSAASGYRGKVLRSVGELTWLDDEGVEADVSPEYWDRMRALLARAPVIVDDVDIDDEPVL